MSKHAQFILFTYHEQWIRWRSIFTVMEAGFLLYVLSSACISWYIFSTLFTIFWPIKSTRYSVFYTKHTSLVILGATEPPLLTPTGLVLCPKLVLTWVARFTVSFWHSVCYGQSNTPFAGTHHGNCSSVPLDVAIIKFLLKSHGSAL